MDVDLPQLAGNKSGMNQMFSECPIVPADSTGKGNEEECGWSPEPQSLMPRLWLTTVPPKLCTPLFSYRAHQVHKPLAWACEWPIWRMWSHDLIIHANACPTTDVPTGEVWQENVLKSHSQKFFCKQFLYCFGNVVGTLAISCALDTVSESHILKALRSARCLRVSSISCKHVQWSLKNSLKR